MYVDSFIYSDYFKYHSSLNSTLIPIILNLDLHTEGEIYIKHRLHLKKEKFSHRPDIIELFFLSIIKSTNSWNT